MKLSVFIAFFCSFIYSHAQNNKIEEYYQQNKGDNKKSQSVGTVSQGKLINGKLMPFSGPNFQYFDTSSYLAGRAFVHEKVKNTILNTYQKYNKMNPNRKFCLMECSYQHGGKLFPHHTHQNGLSVDFMMPLTQNKRPYYGLDNLGKNHYWLEFDNEGKYTKDTSIEIDFELVAQQILTLEKKGREEGLKVKKVIIKIELKDELFSGYFGKQLQKSGIYVVQSLTPLINSLHDDHFHIDFEILK